MGFAIVRGSQAECFERQKVELLTLLLPHLRQSVLTQMHLSAAGVPRDLSAAALDHLATGVLIVDAQGRVKYANTSAEAVLRTGGALRLDLADGSRLCAAGPKQTRYLRDLIARAAHSENSTRLAGSAVRLDHAVAPGQGVAHPARRLQVAPSAECWQLQPVYPETGTVRQARLAHLGVLAGYDNK